MVIKKNGIILAQTLSHRSTLRRDLLCDLFFFFFFIQPMLPFTFLFHFSSALPLFRALYHGSWELQWPNDLMERGCIWQGLLLAWAVGQRAVTWPPKSPTDLPCLAKYLPSLLLIPQSFLWQKVQTLGTGWSWGHFPRMLLWWNAPSVDVPWERDDQNHRDV